MPRGAVSRHGLILVENWKPRGGFAAVKYFVRTLFSKLRGTIMTDKERILRVLNASPETLRKIDDILMDRDKKGRSSDDDIRTLTLTEAAKRLNVSRTTVYRMVKSGCIDIVKISGVNRVRLQSLIDLAFGRR